MKVLIENDNGNSIELDYLREIVKWHYKVILK